jgi:two-component system chemotaxis sensor kinase CheA
MPTEPGQFFGALMDDFFAECDEHLSSLRRLLIELEQKGGERAFAEERVRGVFRTLHTLKGLSGMVGFAESEELAHGLEDWLHRAAPDGFIPPGTSLDTLFEGAGLLERCLQARREEAGPVDVGGFLAGLREELERRGSASPAEAPAPAPAAAPFATDLKLSPAEALRLQAALARGDRALELEFAPTPELVGRGLGVEAVRGRLGALGEIVHVAPRVLPGRGVSFRFLVALAPGAAVPEEWREDGLAWTAAADADTPSPPDAGAPVSAADGAPVPAADGAAAGAAGPATVASNVVRVGLPRLDELLRLVGELVISRSRLDDLLKRSWNGAGVPADALEEINAGMERQLRELREGVMRVRLVAVGETFERMRFVVRDVANAEAKDVRVELQGQDTELDKLVVERMMEPLLHLVRNAVSHGIETPAERTAAGKPPQGVLRLAASAVGERVRMVVEDDGRGIDRRAVAARGRAQGLAVPPETPDDDALLEILSAPGFSTREVADLASGRGVGMDVVRSTVRALGGELTLATEPGRGTRFAVELPLTLMIVDALLVRIGEQTMAVPQPALLEVLLVEAEEVVPFENNEVVRYRGKVLPLVRLGRLFGLGREEGRGSFPVLVVGSEAQPVGLAVDRLAGLREIVVRPLADPLVAVPGIAAAAELGDGRVCLILDSAAVVQLAHQHRGAAAPAHATLSPVGAGHP